MRNLTKLVFQRFVAVSLGILLQLAVIVLGISFLKDYRTWLQVVFMVLSWIAVILIISGRSNPSYKMAWIVLILAFPAAGLTIYLLFGGNKSSSRENRRMQAIEQLMVRHIPQDAAAMEALQSENPVAFNHARYVLHSACYPVYQHSKSCYYPMGMECYTQMLRDLAEAKKYIFLEYFIIDSGFMWDGILKILCEKVAQGVDVRVIYDDFGCIRKLPANYCRQLRKMGIQARTFSPYVPIMSPRLNNRDHRKLMIVDGTVAYTGGINLADEYVGRKTLYGVWKDCGLRVEGAAARSMTVSFLTMWDYVNQIEENAAAFLPELPPAEKTSDGFVQPFADSPLDVEDVGASLFQNIIQNAQKSVWMMTPYLILDEKMSSALCTAAKTGIDVRIITPGIPDKKLVYSVTRANYELLIEAGVKIYEYTPGFLHSKVIYADDLHAVVGTVNLDFRSLYLHYENAVYLYGTQSIAQIGDDFRATFPECRRITYEQCRQVGLKSRFNRSLLRVFSPLM